MLLQSSCLLIEDLRCVMRCGGYWLEPEKKRVDSRKSGSSDGISTTVEGRDEDDLVAFLQDIVELAFEFPIGRVDQDEDARSPVQCRANKKNGRQSNRFARRQKGGNGRNIHCLALREQFRPVPILEFKLAQPPNQEPNIRLLCALGTLLDRFRSSCWHALGSGCGLDGGSWLVVPREDEVVHRLVVEQEFHPAAASHTEQQRHA
jgi:hypothetical protein